MTLHDRIREVVEERLRIARAAAAGHTGTWKNNGFGDSWLITDDGDVVVYDEGSPTEAQADHIAANDPSDAILSAEHALGLLVRHQPAVLRPDTCGGKWYESRTVCSTCSPPLSSLEDMWPCPEILALATRWRVEVDG